MLVEDLFKRVTIKHFFDILLKELGFCAVMCHVESVCTTFGAGLQSACVVDVGLVLVDNGRIAVGSPVLPDRAGDASRRVASILEFVLVPPAVDEQSLLRLS